MVRDVSLHFPLRCKVSWLVLFTNTGFSFRFFLLPKHIFLHLAYMTTQFLTDMVGSALSMHAY